MLIVLSDGYIIWHFEGDKFLLFLLSRFLAQGGGFLLNFVILDGKFIESQIFLWKSFVTWVEDLSKALHLLLPGTPGRNIADAG